MGSKRHWELGSPHGFLPFSCLILVAFPFSQFWLYLWLWCCTQMTASYARRKLCPRGSASFSGLCRHPHSHAHIYTRTNENNKKKSLKSNLHPGTLHVCDSCAALSSCETPSSGNRVCLSLFYCLWDPIPHPGLGKCLVLLFPWETWMRSGLVGNRVWGEETGREGGRETCGWDVYVNTWISKCILKNF